MTAAYQLARAGVAVDVFEASNTIGGLSRTIELWGQRVDLGPHRFFSNDRRINELWLEVVGSDYRMVDRLTRIYYGKRFYHYPLKPGNALWNMGFYNACAAVCSYLAEQIRPSFKATDNQTFESWVVGRFGRRLYEMFFKSYSEKLWGIPCNQLDADFAAQRIKKFSLGEAVKAALGFGGKHKTLVDQFAYPIGGTGMVYDRMARRVEEMGGRVHLKAPVNRILHDGVNVAALDLVDGRVIPFDHVISTMPLTLLVRGLHDLPDHVRAGVDRLRFRNTILVYLHVAGADLFRDQWLYIHSPELGAGRVTNFRNWVPDLYGDSPNTILAAEYWCYDEDADWKEPDAGLIARAERELRSTGLLADRRVLDGAVHRIKRCYPVYERGYKKHLEPVIEHLRRFRNLQAIGRYGSFKYNNQDHSILMGLLAAENILQGRGHNLWAVNTDDEYQEAATITRTGLQIKPSRQPASSQPQPASVN
jgi:protoporphyrinogen oxidase